MEGIDHDAGDSTSVGDNMIRFDRRGNQRDLNSRASNTESKEISSAQPVDGIFRDTIILR